MSSSTTFAKNDSNESNIQLNIQKKSLVKKSTYQLRVRRTVPSQKVVFYSSAPNIVSVKNKNRTSAVIRAKNVGSANIDVLIFNSDDILVQSLSCKITVTVPAYTVQIPVRKIILKPNETFALDKIINVKPKTTVEAPKFSSSNSNIASISARGMITAHQPGKTVIKVSLTNGKFDTCKIVVKKLPRSTQTAKRK